ncbi:MAG: FlgD immunoglobulin-like domain containing protein [Candidatus Stygibacter frigidus]|nr:FlgD immunoglobulin-like domain containing protein [Candidatus Stygibacter frigidus]
MKKLFIIFVLALLLLSCSDDESSENGELFSLKVVDIVGNSVQGLIVRINNVNNAFSNVQTGGRPQTVISFSVSEMSRIELEIFNLQNELVRTLTDDNLEAGEHQIVWNGVNNDAEPPNIGGTNIFRYEMTATDTASGEVLYNESKYMCMELLVFPDLSIVGSTDDEGAFHLNNKLAFPHLFNLGEQPIYDEDANYNGTFTLSDSINIKLTNPDTDQYMIFTVLMDHSDHHHYNLVWDYPLIADAGIGVSEIPSQPVIIDRDNDDDGVPISFELRQNYPNPFN